MQFEEKLDILADYFGQWPELGVQGVGGIKKLLEEELGSVMSLEVGEKKSKEELQFKVIPPRHIYHVCASNLAVSAETSLIMGLILGSDLIFRLPKAGLKSFEEKVEGLPDVFKRRVKILKGEERENREFLEKSDAVVVYGADETVELFHRKVSWKQRFLGYGHKISLGVIPGGNATAYWAGEAVREIMAYQQLGCLSPQTYLCQTEEEALLFGRQLAEALKSYLLEHDELTNQRKRAGIEFEVAARIEDFRNRALARGDQVRKDEEGEKRKTPGWTVVIRKEPVVEAGPGWGSVDVISLEKGLEWAQEVKGMISSLSVAESVISTESKKLALEIGATRICRMGQLQRPSLRWKHDGRPRLADLVTWLTVDEGE